ncbi:hypothetical protein KCU64_g6, partial [Aureobasidium melanogenum]
MARASPSSAREGRGEAQLERAERVTLHHCHATYNKITFAPITLHLTRLTVVKVMVNRIVMLLFSNLCHIVHCLIHQFSCRRWLSVANSQMYSSCFGEHVRRCRRYQGLLLTLHVCNHADWVTATKRLAVGVVVCELLDGKILARLGLAGRLRGRGSVAIFPCLLVVVLFCIVMKLWKRKLPGLQRENGGVFLSTPLARRKLQASHHECGW